MRTGDGCGRMGDGWAGNRFLFRVAFACGLFAGRSLNRPLGDLPDEIAMSTAFGKSLFVQVTAELRHGGQPQCVYFMCQ